MESRRNVFRRRVRALRAVAQWPAETRVPTAAPRLSLGMVPDSAAPQDPQLQNARQWDENAFLNNQFSHPHHGNRSEWRPSFVRAVPDVG